MNAFLLAQGGWMTMNQQVLYPPHHYLYQTGGNPAEELLRQVVVNHQMELINIRNTPFRKSVEAEKVIAKDMKDLGFLHSVTNRKHSSLFKAGLNFEVDFFHPQGQQVQSEFYKNTIKRLCHIEKVFSLIDSLLLIGY